MVVFHGFWWVYGFGSVFFLMVFGGSLVWFGIFWIPNKESDA